MSENTNNETSENQSDLPLTVPDDDDYSPPSYTMELCYDTIDPAIAKHFSEELYHIVDPRLVPMENYSMGNRLAERLLQVDMRCSNFMFTMKKFVDEITAIKIERCRSSHQLSEDYGNARELRDLLANINSLEGKIAFTTFAKSRGCNPCDMIKNQVIKVRAEEHLFKALFYLIRGDIPNELQRFIKAKLPNKALKQMHQYPHQLLTNQDNGRTVLHYVTYHRYNLRCSLNTCKTNFEFMSTDGTSPVPWSRSVALVSRRPATFTK